MTDNYGCPICEGSTGGSSACPKHGQQFIEIPVTMYHRPRTPQPSDDAERIAELYETIRLASQKAAREKVEKTWRCFHCDFQTCDPKEAEAHFGDGEGEPSLCLDWAKMTVEDRTHEYQQVILQLNSERDEGIKLLRRAETAEAALAEERAKKEGV